MHGKDRQTGTLSGAGSVSSTENRLAPLSKPRYAQPEKTVADSLIDRMADYVRLSVLYAGCDEKREAEELLREYDAQGAGGGAVAPFCWWRQRGPGVDEEFYTEYSEDSIRPAGEGWQPLYTHPSLASDFTMEDASKLAMDFEARMQDENDWAATHMLAALNATFSKGRPAAGREAVE